jgi:hypothetical protein
MSCSKVGCGFVSGRSAAAARLACKAVLVDCDDATRARRLSVDRGQPDLANDEMVSWAVYLRDEAAAFRCDVLDTTRLSIADGAAAVTALFPG